MPEIALTAQLLERFARRFGRPPALWHSELGAAARRRTWRRIAEGREPIVIGARSALFLPLPALGLIVVDEEHDTSFKQEDGVPYHGREVAIARARLEGCPAILVSATPALETAWRMGRIAGAVGPRAAGDALLLPARHGGSAMPAVALIDLRRDRPPRGGWLAPGLRAALEATLGAGEQALLFLNRRGFAPLTLVPRLRPSPALPELQRLAGDPPPAPPPALPSLRLRPRRARPLPELRHGRCAGRLRPGRRAPGRGGPGAAARRARSRS